MGSAGQRTAASSHPLTRRTVARGAAWSLPVLAVGAAAPAMAASFPPGLQGWIWWTRDCTNSGQIVLSLDGDPAGQVYPNSQYGLYVFNTTASTVLTNACVTFNYSPGCSDPMTWSAMTGSGSAWSIPARISGSTYRTCYTGLWTFHAASGTSPSYSIANQVPKFTSTTTCNCQTQTITITRSVTVNGTAISFDRVISV